MTKLKILTLTFLTYILTSCGEGYEKTDGKWTWVLNSEAGKHIREINSDYSTFEILENKEYAKDKNTVYRRGIEIENADPKTFKVISDNGYAMDEYHVFLDEDIVIFANPKTFEIIKWPYSRDDQRIYNGNLPMEVDNIDEFEITKDDGRTSSSIKSFFVEWNEDYKWLDTLNVKGIIVGEYAEAKTKNEKYKGFRKIE